MKKYGKAQIIARLKNEGVVFSEFSLIHEGDYAIEDADWNYKDVPHLHYVHELAEAIPAVVGDDLIATINMQKVLMFRFPFSLFNFESGENTQTYYTTWLWYVLIIETAYESLGPCRTRVKTTYAVGSPRFLKWTFPLIRWVLKRNYDNLMSTDIPMRKRRGQLRSWGYSFFREGEKYSFVKTMDVMKSNVIPPKLSGNNKTERIVVESVLREDGEFLVSRDDHLGFRMVRQGTHLSLFPRTCPHEGASLDGLECVDGRLRCPWHGRVFDALATFDLSNAGEQIFNTKYSSLNFKDGVLTILTLPHE